MKSILWLPKAGTWGQRIKGPGCCPRPKVQPTHQTSLWAGEHLPREKKSWKWSVHRLIFPLPQSSCWDFPWHGWCLLPQVKGSRGPLHWCKVLHFAQLLPPQQAIQAALFNSPTKSLPSSPLACLQQTFVQWSLSRTLHYRNTNLLNAEMGVSLDKTSCKNQTSHWCFWFR